MLAIMVFADLRICSQAVAILSSDFAILMGRPSSFSGDELLCPIYRRMGLKFVRIAYS